jgi:nucleoid DNA-binding protein
MRGDRIRSDHHRLGGLDMSSIWIKLRWLKRDPSRRELAACLREMADKVEAEEQDGLVSLGHFKINDWNPRKTIEEITTFTLGLK